MRYYIDEYSESDGWEIQYGAIVMDSELNRPAEIFVGKQAKKQAEAWIARQKDGKENTGAGLPC